MNPNPIVLFQLICMVGLIINSQNGWNALLFGAAFFAGMYAIFMDRESENSDG